MRTSKVKEVCVEVEEDVYREILILRARGITLKDILLKGIEYYKTRAQIVSRPSIQYSECGIIKPYEYCWPPCRGRKDLETFEEARCFEVIEEGVRHRFYIAYGFRWAYGRNRRRVVVFRVGLRGGIPTPIVEFAGTDDYSSTRSVVSLIKRPDKKYMRTWEVNSYLEYAELTSHIVDHASVIRRGRKGYASLHVKEDDVDGILRHALIQYKWRRGI